MEHMTCNICGARLEPGDSFCIACGNRVGTVAEEKTAAAANPEPRQTGDWIGGKYVAADRVIIQNKCWFYPEKKLTPKAGTVALTESTLRFESGMAAKAPCQWVIPLSRVDEVARIRAGLVYQIIGVRCDGVLYRMELTDSKNWIAQIRAAVAGCKENPAPGERKTDKADYIDELRRLRELVDMGIVTEEEFAAKKKQLLGL